ncbi:MAG TPA: HNH endonuclease [Candidatus Bathyarchaeota archaeon]|nr:HNH endonuclease [Candidatus Bathyarchaeota archaeon]
MARGHRRGSRARRRCAFCGSTENLQLHHVGRDMGGLIWVCERCHNKEHRKFKVSSPNRKALRAWARAEGLNLKELRKALSIYSVCSSSDD